jgi:hypothetical protein
MGLEAVNPIACLPLDGNKYPATHHQGEVGQGNEKLSSALPARLLL